MAAMAFDALRTGKTDAFFKRYDVFHSWADLDRFYPPDWLNENEALKGFAAFHNAFSPSPLQPRRVTEEPLTWKPSFEVSVFLDQVRSPYNVGSVLRIIDNFGFSEMVHSSGTLSLEHPRLKKSARGCERWIPVRYENDPVAWLRKSAVPVVGIEKTDDALDVSDWQPPEKCVLIAGNEEYGIAAAIRECCTETVFIPMHGFKKSMNVNNALSVVSQKIVEKNSLKLKK